MTDKNAARSVVSRRNARIDIGSIDKVESLLSALIKSRKTDVSNRESRTVIADLFDIEKLRALHDVFVLKNKAEKADDDLCVAAEDFKGALRDLVDKQEVSRIYAMIDVNESGIVSWQNLTNFLIAMESSNRQAEGHITHHYVLRDSQKMGANMHRDTVEAMCFVQSPKDGYILITGGKDGRILLWDVYTLARKGEINHSDKNSVYTSALVQSSEREQRAMLARSRTGSQKKKKTDNPFMITSLVPMIQSSHLLVGCADSSITCYDLTSSTVCGRYTEMTSVPVALEVVYLTHHVSAYSSVLSGGGGGAETTTKKLPSPNKNLADRRQTPVIFAGDTEGCLHIITLDADFKATSDAAQKQKNEFYFRKGVKEITKLRVQAVVSANSWITAMQYFEEMNALAVGLFDGDIVLVDVEKHFIRNIFKGHRGSIVRAIAWSSSLKYACSAGERKIIVWDAFNVETTTTLDGLSSSALAVHIEDDAKKLFVAALDKSVRIWHTITFEILQVVLPGTPDESLGQHEHLSAFLFVPFSGYFYTATNVVSIWAEERKRSSDDNISTTSGGGSDEASGTRHDFCTVLFNKAFKTAITVSHSGSVVVYNVEDGSDSNRFQIPNVANLETSKPLSTDKMKSGQDFSKFIIRAMLDAQDKRLVVLTSQSSVQFWNFTCGTLIFEVRPQVPTSLAHLTARNREAFRLTSISYEVVHSTEGISRFLILGTNCGFVCCLAEKNGIDDEPTFSLIRSEEVIASIESNRAGAKSNRQNTPSTNKSVVNALFSVYIGDSKLVVSYSDGLLNIWDLNRAQTLADIDTKATGIILNSMKRSTGRGVHLVASKVAKHDQEKHQQEKSKLIGALGILKSFHHDGPAEESDDGSVSEAKNDKIGILVDNKNDQGAVTLQTIRSAVKGARERTRSTAQGSTVSVASLVPTRPSLYLDVRPSLRARLTVPHLGLAQNMQRSNFGAGDEGKGLSTENNSLKISLQNAHADEALFAAIEKSRSILRSYVGDVEKASNKKINILVVDSNRVCLKFTSRLLNFAGYSVTSTDSVEAAMDFLASEDISFSAVILDIFMSGKAGKLFSKYLISELCVDFPLIFTSSSPELEEEAMNAGASMFLKTPTGFESIVDATRKVLDPSFKLHQAPSSNSRVIVECAVFFESTYVLVGVCSDALLRFWDLATGRILCSCVTDESGDRSSRARTVRAPDESTLQFIKAAYNEATIVGAYDNGVIRVWEVTHSSIDALRSALYDKMEAEGEGDLVHAVMESIMKERVMNVTSNTHGMAVCPLSLISEWRAHEATIVSIEYVSLADNPSVTSFTAPLCELYPGRFDVGEDPEQYEKHEFILSCGMDQVVYLWSIHGKLIGIFGRDDWDVRSSLSFREPEHIYRDKMRQAAVLQPNPPACAKPSSQRGVTQQTGRSLEDQIKWRIYRDQVRGIGSTALNSYVQSLNSKQGYLGDLVTKQNREYQTLSNKHPVSNTVILEENFKKSVPEYDRNITSKKQTAATIGTLTALGKFLHHPHAHHK